MKSLVGKSELCIGCYKCEEVCSQAYYKEKYKLKSAIRIKENGKENFLIQVCNQCGHCSEACQVCAISRDKNGIVKIKKELCVGCLACVGNCPTDTMYYHDDLAEPFKCTACGLCVKECPTGAIVIDEA